MVNIDKLMRLKGKIIKHISINEFNNITIINIELNDGTIIHNRKGGNIDNPLCISFGEDGL